MYRNVTGGLMIVKKSYWEKLGGMDERLIRNQDLDYGLRMAKIGIPALLSHVLFANHHTSDYFNKRRYSAFYFSKALFSTGLLMRKHFFYRAYLKRNYQEVINVNLLFCAISLLFIEPLLSLFLLTIYTTIHIVTTIKNIKNENINIRSFLFKYLFNFYCLFGLLFYYPSNPTYFVNKEDY